MLPLAVQLVGFRQDNGLLLLALPLITAVIIFFPPLLFPLWVVKNQLLAVPQNWANGPSFLGAERVDAGWDGASFAGKLLKNPQPG